MKKINKENLLKTILISLPLYLFIAFLIYLIYVFVFYDMNNTNQIVKKINNYDYNYIYNNLYYKKEISKEQYDKVINNTYNKDNILKIYNTYYKDKYNEKDFLKKYYHGEYKVEDLNVTYVIEGKTNLFNRRKLFIYSITNNDINLSIVKNVTFVTNNYDSYVYYDDEEIRCYEVCSIMYNITGNHEIRVKENGNEYYSLITISSQGEMIYLDNLEELIKVQ